MFRLPKYDPAGSEHLIGQIQRNQTHSYPIIFFKHGKDFLGPVEDLAVEVDVFHGEEVNVQQVVSAPVRLLSSTIKQKSTSFILPAIFNKLDLDTAMRKQKHIHN